MINILFCIYIVIPKHTLQIREIITCGIALFLYNSANSTTDPKISVMISRIIVLDPEPKRVDDNPIMTRAPRLRIRVESTETFVIRCLQDEQIVIIMHSSIASGTD